MKSISAVIEWINVIAICILGATFVLPSQFQIPAFYFYAGTMVLDFFYNKRWKGVKPFDKYRWIFIPMIFYYLCIWLWHPFEESNLPLFKYVAENRLPFLIFGLLGLFSNINPRFKPQQLAISMSVSGILVTFWILFFGTDLGYNIPESIKDYQQIFAKCRVENFGSHMTFNLFFNTTIVCLIYCLLHASRKIWTAVYTILLVILYAILLTTEGRTGFVTANVLVSFLICYKIWKYNKYMLAPVVMICVIAGLVLVNNQTRFKQFDVNTNARRFIWKTALHVIKEKPILGYGVSDGRKAYVDYSITDYEFCNYYYWGFAESRPDEDLYVHHPHNMLLNSMLEFGIVGLILFLSMFLFPFFTLKSECRAYVLLFCFTFGMQAMMESPGQHLPPIMFCWFIYLFILYYHLKE